jgi:hypothetical protein
VRLSLTERRGALRLAGAERLRVLEDLAPFARTLRGFGDESGQTSAWELDFGGCRFTLAISADVWRGFSGEGQALEALAGSDEGLVARLRAQLRWQAVLDLDAIAELGAVGHAAAVLGSRGLVGYDLGPDAYFHRELPFDLSRVEALHPRLTAARALVAAGKVAIRGADPVEADVAGPDVVHRVRLGDDDRCTCPWYAKHRGDRGPCKHVLAARLAVEGET